MRVAFGGNITLGFVKFDIGEITFQFDDIAINPNLGLVLIYLCTRICEDLAVHLDAALKDQVIAFSSGVHTAMGEEFI
jgi:hypothetical protein